MLGLKSVQQSQEIFQTHNQDSLKNADYLTCRMCVVVWLLVSPGEMGAYLIFLTGLRLAAMIVRHAQSKHILFIGSFLMCQELKSSHQRLLTAGFHSYCTNAGLMTRLSSVELWK